jgi:hypothetical protein
MVSRALLAPTRSAARLYPWTLRWHWVPLTRSWWFDRLMNTSNGTGAFVGCASGLNVDTLAGAAPMSIALWATADNYSAPNRQDKNQLILRGEAVRFESDNSSTF